MKRWKVRGPEGERLVESRGRWDACNEARSLDKGRDYIDLADIAALVSRSEAQIELRYISDGVHYTANEVEDAG